MFVPTHGRCLSYSTDACLILLPSSATHVDQAMIDQPISGRENEGH